MLSSLGLLQSMIVLPEIRAPKEDEVTGLLVHLDHFSISWKRSRVDFDSLLLFKYLPKSILWFGGWAQVGKKWFQTGNVDVHWLFSDVWGREEVHSLGTIDSLWRTALALVQNGNSEKYAWRWLWRWLSATYRGGLANELVCFCRRKEV